MRVLLPTLSGGRILSHLLRVSLKQSHAQVRAWRGFQVPGRWRRRGEWELLRSHIQGTKLGPRVCMVSSISSEERRLTQSQQVPSSA